MGSGMPTYYGFCYTCCLVLLCFVFEKGSWPVAQVDLELCDSGPRSLLPQCLSGLGYRHTLHTWLGLIVPWKSCSLFSRGSNNICFRFASVPQTSHFLCLLPVSFPFLNCWGCQRAVLDFLVYSTQFFPNHSIHVNSPYDYSKTPKKPPGQNSR